MVVVHDLGKIKMINTDTVKEIRTAYNKQFVVVVKQFVHRLGMTELDATVLVNDLVRLGEISQELTFTQAMLNSGMIK